MYAYAECYLDDAMRNLGEAVEYAVCRCSLLPDRFMEMFIAGGLADGFEKGSPRYVSGMSGTELACETIHRAGLHRNLPDAVSINEYSQKMLSQRSGVSLRMIQQYEQGAKDIRKASASGLLALAGTLHCDMEDLICG